MKPVSFKEQTNILQNPGNMTDEESGILPVFYDGEMSISCWRMSFIERIKAILYGRIWLYVRSKGHPPGQLQCYKTVFKKTS